MPVVAGCLVLKPSGVTPLELRQFDFAGIYVKMLCMKYKPCLGDGFREKQQKNDKKISQNFLLLITWKFGRRKIVGN